MDKNTNSIQADDGLDGRVDLVKTFQNSLVHMDQTKLDLTIKKLNFLCLNFDPYSLTMSTEVENIINEYKLLAFTTNPFHFTNIVLQILDKTENEIKSRVH